VGRKKVKTEEKIDIRIRIDRDLQQYVQDRADTQRVSVAAYIRALILKDSELHGKKGKKA
jgi:hypothetical protein